MPFASLGRGRRVRRTLFQLLTWGLVGAERSLRSPVRRKMLDIIMAERGITVRDLARRAGTTWPNAKYHVVRLENAGLVRSIVLGRRRLVFSADDMTGADVAEARMLLAQPSARRIAAFLVDHPGVGLAELLAGTGLSQRAVYYHLKKFLDAGLVEHSNEARYRGLRPTPLLYRALL